MSEQQVLPEWECFRDSAYYDMWCARKVGERRFGFGYHVSSEAEARALCDEMSALIASLAQSEAERERLQGELFEMCKLCHRYQNELWSDAKVAADPSNPLRAELARERELNQGLRQVVKEYRSGDDRVLHVFCDFPDERCSPCIKADALLEDKAKPVATNKEEEK